MANACVCRCTEALSPLKTRTENDWMTEVPRKLSQNTSTIIPPPRLGQMVSKGEAQGRHLDPRAGLR